MPQHIPACARLSAALLLLTGVRTLYEEACFWNPFSPLCSLSVPQIHARMRAYPSNAQVQDWGCQALYYLAWQNMDGDFFRRVKPHLLQLGVGTAMADGLQHTVSCEGAAYDVKRAEFSCLSALQMLGVAYDHGRGVALHRSAPHIWSALIGFIRKHQAERDVLLQIRTFGAIYGHLTPEVTPGFVEAGGFDLVFEVLDNNASDWELWAAGWSAISDHVEGSPLGASVLADHGGAGRGCEYIVRHMRMAHGVHYWPPGQPFGINYQILHDANGMFLHDTGRAYADGCVRAGILEEIVVTMQDEPGDRLVQDTCCIALKWVTEGSAATQELLAEAGALGLIAEAMRRFPGPPAFEHWPYPVVPTCVGALLNFARGSTPSQDAMLQLGVLDILNGSLPLFDASSERQNPWVAPWRSRFPLSGLAELWHLLAGRRDRRAPAGGGVAGAGATA